MNQYSESKPLHPWKSIAASLVASTETRRDYSAAMRSPCESCPTAPCCSHLPLTTFRVATLSDLDYAVYLLNFERIELGLSSAGDWSVFYRYPCRFLDRKTFACTLHDRPEQPHICRRYNPYKCWYKTALTTSISPDYLRLDQARLQHLITGIGFDDRGNIVESPDWQNLLQALEHIHDPSAASHADGVSQPEAPPVYELVPTYRNSQLQEPCNGCAAHCCKVLMFPVDRPADLTGLDYLKFCLGFPGIRVGISDGQWAILVDTKCRHLSLNRCSIFGRPERPLVCRYYDEWRCAYKLHFERAESAGVLYVGLEQYRRLLESIELDRNGSVQGWPPIAELRKLVEQPSARAPAAASIQAVEA